HAKRTTSLNHEAVDDPGKNQAVIKRSFDLLLAVRIGPFFGTFGQADEVIYCLWSLVTEQPHHTSAFRRRETCVSSWVHVKFLLLKNERKCLLGFRFLIHAPSRLEHDVFNGDRELTPVVYFFVHLGNLINDVHPLFHLAEDTIAESHL